MKRLILILTFLTNSCSLACFTIFSRSGIAEVDTIFVDDDVTIGIVNDDDTIIEETWNFLESELGKVLLLMYYT